MGRYIRKMTPLSPAPAPVEHSHETWVGFDLPWLSGDLSHLGLIAADHFTSEQLHAHGIVSFDVVGERDTVTLRLLGLSPTEPS